MKDNWKEIAKASERDPKVIDILENGSLDLFLKRGCFRR